MIPTDLFSYAYIPAWYDLFSYAYIPAWYHGFHFLL